MKERTHVDNLVAQPIISVCLASYNGEKHIYAQIASILPELTPLDELIVCDDNSSDSTCSIVKSFNDPRIILINNERNLGHVRNFEKVLSVARGKYIFLSDQDDIWAVGKINKVLLAFQKDSGIRLVYHNLTVIDDEGNILSQRFPQHIDKIKNSFFFILRQLIKAQIFGCACCIDQRLLNKLLPFPKYVYAQDHWIAISAAIHGKVYFLKDSLTKYRQHGSNLTPKKHYPLNAILILRTKMLLQLIIAIFRKSSKNKI
jgi:glycosyltransferase involved in cell wall biosynthesis